jgi:hypothetical protein
MEPSDPAATTPLLELAPGDAPTADAPAKPTRDDDERGRKLIIAFLVMVVVGLGNAIFRVLYVRSQPRRKPRGRRGPPRRPRPGPRPRTAPRVRSRAPPSWCRWPRTTCSATCS